MEKEIRNQRNLLALGEYLKSKQDSDEIIGRFNEICVYCNELERQHQHFTLERIPKQYRVGFAKRMYEYIRSWLIANRKI